MKNKKILLLLFACLFLAGCVNIRNLSYSDVINRLSLKAKSANTYKRGYKYYVPKGLVVTDAGANYSVLENGVDKYYVFFDLVLFNGDKDINHELDKTSLYSEGIYYDGKKGYVEIKLRENNKYLIEIVYNYAKIEVMVDESNINIALNNSVNILNSVKYDKIVIEKMLSEDNLIYSEEEFDLFEKVKNSSDYLDYGESSIDVDNDIIKDTDFLN